MGSIHDGSHRRACRDAGADDRFTDEHADTAEHRGIGAAAGHSGELGSGSRRREGHSRTSTRRVGRKCDKTGGLIVGCDVRVRRESGTEGECRTRGHRGCIAEDQTGGAAATHNRGAGGDAGASHQLAVDRSSAGRNRQRGGCSRGR